ncbi:ABC transporter substrate-binding protein [Desulfococcus multivorans]|uniref:ABC-type transporter, periplasmic subunit n=1 Tax=Desulfococcus multivorans DSM 2059 TaxID=1121405 RepID=S7TPR2_DESML|nr:ABC transporter substrate-binding protein [Desulfococcus multivorans]AOY57849.1 GsiB: predicted glutathione-binding protein [Desulfococcus multivorans]AQV00228.1 nickel/dipeptide/oligopeptide ABC transporter substrate-binding protein [Desulfococcus multivorans]EPR38931.1 ABC-type transporter, periplasmic subunit [Desulfococcus multivorans DSM 2059]SJZ67082.1 peptide/nickel transport system substrate-binding protein [Desulfococcus multivorans DSM 2059]
MNRSGWTVIILVGMGWLAALSGASEEQILKLGAERDPVSLDPHAQLSAETLQYAHMVFDPLVRRTADMTFEPRLAERWERISDRAMRFYLKRGVTFHSGNPFTVEDVKWTVHRLMKSPDYNRLFKDLEDVKIIDDQTVDLVTQKPCALILNMAALIFPMDRRFYRGMDENGRYKDAVVTAGPSFAATHASGTGKYHVTMRDPGLKTVFQKFPGYWDDKSLGNIDRIILIPIKNDAARVSALRSGNVDMITPVPPQDYGRIEADENLRLIAITGSRIITLQLNQKRRPEFRNPQVRLAMNWAVNKADIVEKIMKGAATAAGQQGPKGFSGYTPRLTPRFDPAKAKALMKSAGYENGFECTMIAPNNRYVNDAKVAEAVAVMLSRINITVDLKTLPRIHYWDRFDAQTADIQMIGWHPEMEDSANYTENLLMCPDTETGYGRYNSGNYCNAKVDELILASRMETGNARRRVLLQKVEQILYDEAAFIPLHWEKVSWAGKRHLGIEPVVNLQNVAYFGDLMIH